jgi:hypothetical protein
MNIITVKLNENEAKSLINDVEISPELPPKILVFKILQKAGKPLHYHDIEYVVVKKGYYQAHNKDIPKKPYLSLFHLFRNDSRICKTSDGIYGLKEWESNDLTNNFKEEVDVTAQAAQQDSNNANNGSEELSIPKRNCPECDDKIDIKRHFCKYCGIDLFEFCSNCLGKIDDDSIFCADCGIKLEQRIKKSTCM